VDGAGALAGLRFLLGVRVVTGSPEEGGRRDENVGTLIAFDSGLL
jgi:hypothetical protein